VSRRTAALRLGALAAALAAFVLVLALSGSISAGRVRAWVDGYGAAGPLVFVAVSAALTVVLFPGPVLAAASGLLFGTALGTPVSIVSATLGAVLAFVIARFVARDSVDAIAGRRLRAAQEWIEQRGFWAVLYGRIIPGLPYTLLNYVAGLTRVRLAAFAAATAVGVAPRSFAYTALGGSLDDLDAPEAIVAVVLLVLMGAGGLVALRRGGLGGARAAGSGTATSIPGPRSAGPR
jgi:uncharacterized membrane protein YdjX (TVP38/TMEM64 family)